MSKCAISVLKRELLFFGCEQRPSRKKGEIIFIFSPKKNASISSSNACFRPSSLNATERRWQSEHLKLNRGPSTSDLQWLTQERERQRERERVENNPERSGAGGFSLRMVLYVSAATAKSSDITGASADTTHGRWILMSRALSKRVNLP